MTDRSDQTPSERTLAVGRKASVRTVVVTTGNPKLEPTLAALSAQSAKNLAVTVVDASGEIENGDESPLSVDEIASRYHASVVAAPSKGGFAAAANVILNDASLDTEWLLFCHDEIALEPTAVETLVEGATASGAAVATPKILDWDAPDVLRDVGMSSDKFGYPYTAVEPGEVDHGQHDGDRDVLYASTACLLVRSDLFRALGGFDSELGSVEVDLDFCWRARLAGAGVSVVPGAKAFHAPGEIDHGQVARPRLVGERNRLRIILKNYSLLVLPGILVQLALLNLLEAFLNLISGRGARSFSPMRAWAYNFRHFFRTMRSRSRVQASRVKPDSEIRSLQVHGSARVRAYVESRLRAREDELTPVSLQSSGSGVWEFLIHEVTRPQVLFWAGAIAVSLVCARRLVFQPLPLVGQVVSLPSGLGPFREFVQTWHTNGLGNSLPASPGSVVVGIVQLVTLGRPGLSMKLILVGSYLIGIVGAWRLAGRLGRWPGPALATVLYGLSPVIVGAFQRGSVSSIVFFGLMPFIFSSIMGHLTDPGRPVSRVIRLSVLLAVASSFFPPAIAAAIGISVLLAVASFWSGRIGRSFAGVLTTIVASGIAFALNLPWSLEMLRQGSPLVESYETWGDATVRLGAAGVLRLQTSPAGIASLGDLQVPWGYLPAALGLLALVFTTGPRLGHVARLWPVALGSMAVVWLAGQEVVPAALPLAPGALIPAGLALALVGGLLGSEFGSAGDKAGNTGSTDHSEIGGSRRRTRALAWLVALPTAAALAFPLWLMLGGRLGMPSTENRRALQPVEAAAQEASFRVLWLGRARDVPGSPKPLPGGVGGAYAITGPSGPELLDLWPSPSGRGERVLGQTLASIASEGSSRGGRSLAMLGIRYVVIPDELREGPIESGSPPPEILAGLRRQLDIEEIQSPKGVTLLEVSPEDRMWDASVVGPLTVRAGREGSQEALFGADLSNTPPAFAAAEPGASAVVSVPADGGIIVAQEFDERWKISSGGSPVAATHELMFGWSNGFVFGGPVDSLMTLEFDSGDERFYSVLIEMASWALLLAVLAFVRSRQEEEELPERLAAVG